MSFFFYIFVMSKVSVLTLKGEFLGGKSLFEKTLSPVFKD